MIFSEQLRQSKVPEVTAGFWVVKALTTAFGESASDYLVHVMAPALAVVLGFAAFAAALAWQVHADRYRPARYWFAVAMVGTFGTMAADVLHVGLGVPYLASALLFAAVLTAVFVGWRRTEGSVSPHSVTSARRELFYWAAVVATFAMGTAVGDFAANVVGLGYLSAGLTFAALVVVPAAGFRWMHLDGVVAFWLAYVLTRPFGASVADWLGKSQGSGGVGIGNGPVALILGLAISAFVAYFAVSGVDTPSERPDSTRMASPS